MTAQPTTERHELEMLFAHARQLPLLNKDDEQRIDADKWDATGALLSAFVADEATRLLLQDWVSNTLVEPPRVEQFAQRELYFLLRSELGPSSRLQRDRKQLEALQDALRSNGDIALLVKQLITSPLNGPLAVAFAQIALGLNVQGGLAGAMQTWMRRWQNPKARYSCYRCSEPRSMRLLVRSYENARDQLVSHNLRLVFSIAARYADGQQDIPDLCQEGCVGLMRAAEKFDYRKGYRFSTYAYNWIAQAIRRFAADQGGTIRYPAHVRENLQRLWTLDTELAVSGARPPGAVKMAEKLGIEVEEFHRLRQLRNRGYSLDQAFNSGAEDGEHSWHERLADNAAPAISSEAEQSKLRRLVFAQVDALEPAERQVVLARWGLLHDRPLSRAELADQLQVSREWVRQLESSALAKLRDSDAMREAGNEYGLES